MQSFKQISPELPLERAVLLAGYFCLGRNSPKLLQLFLAMVVFLPLHIDTNFNDDEGDANVMQWPKDMQYGPSAY
jgi:hypothetical protein